MTGEDSGHGGVPAEAIDFLAPPQATDEIGRLGPYRILKVLGAGGMGIVFQAEDEQLQRQVAVKAMLPTLAASAAARQRFQREARAAAAIEHDHIVAIHQVGEDRGVPFIAMPLLQGEPLEERLQRQPLLPLAVVLRIGRETADGLQAAHERGLIHRDIKPANVWLEGKGGRVKILDFGLARSARSESTLTQQGAIVGTPAYMAPEQATGGTVDGRADLFSLGCVLYRLTTGVVPFQGTDPIATLMAVATEQLAPPHDRNPAVPRALSDLVMRLLEKKPEDRMATAQEVAEALRQIEAGLAVPLPEAAPPRGSRKRVVAVLLATALAALLLVGGAVLWWSRRATEEPVASSPQPTSVGPVDGKPSVPHEPSGQPLSPLALAAAPTPIPGVRSWSVEPKTHRGAITLAALRPDNKRVATAGADGAVRIWDSVSQDLVKVLLGHGGAVQAAAWSPDGTRLASAGEDRTVRVWDADTGRLLHTLSGHEAAVRAVAWSRDGKRLASAGDDRTVRLWDAESGKSGRVFTKHDGPVTFVAWRPDGKLVSVQDTQGVKRAWLWQDAIATEGRSHDFDGPAAWSSDFKVLACRDGARPAVRFWNADEGKVERTVALEKQQAPINLLAWSDASKQLATGDHNVVRFWDDATGRLLQTSTDARDDTVVIGLALSPDGKQALSINLYHPGVALRSSESKEPLRRMNGPFRPSWTGWSLDGKTAMGVGPGGVALWEAGNAKVQFTCVSVNPWAYNVAWSPDGKTIADSWGMQKKLALWDAGTGRFLRIFERPAGADNEAIGWWSPDGKSLALLQPPAVQLFDFDTGKPLATLDRGGIKQFFWSPDSKRLATGSWDGTNCLWEAKGGKLLRVAGWPVEERYATFSRDGRRFFVCARERLLAWEAEGDAEPKEHFKTDAWLTSIALSPDGTTLALGDSAGAIKLCAADTGAAGLIISKAHPGPIHRLAWLSDGKQVVSLGETDGAVCYRDAVTGKRRGRAEGILGHGLFSPDGRFLAVNGSPPGLRVWDVATGHVLGVLLLFPGQPDRFVTVSPSGHYRGSAGIEQELVYVVDAGQGQELLDPEAFTKKYQWTNDPEKVRLTDR
jgi:WD40 repeat protein